MTEAYIRIEGPDQNGIYGKHTQSASNKLIIHIHGMTHNMNYLLEVESAAFFTAQGYDHYRPSLYSIEQDSRKLSNSTLSTHTRDIQSMIDYFANDYDEIFITAHSLGGLATVILNPQNITAISLWDPAFDVTHFWTRSTFLAHMPERKQYQLDYGNIFVISEELVDEIKLYPDQKCQELAAHITTPAQMIIPQESIFLASPHTSPESYANAFKGDFDLQHMDKANHTFSHAGNPDRLFNLTLDWFNRALAA